MFGADYFDPYEFVAPKNERATLKDVPIVYRDHPTIRFLTSIEVGGRVRYPRNGDIREGADTFSVYLD